MKGDDEAQDVAHDANFGARVNPTAIAVPEGAPLLSTADGQPIAMEVTTADMATKTAHIPVRTLGALKT